MIHTEAARIKRQELEPIPQNVLVTERANDIPPLVTSFIFCQTVAFHNQASGRNRGEPYNFIVTRSPCSMINSATKNKIRVTDQTGYKHASDGRYCLPIDVQCKS